MASFRAVSDFPNNKTPTSDNNQYFHFDSMHKNNTKSRGECTNLIKNYL